MLALELNSVSLKMRNKLTLVFAIALFARFQESTQERSNQYAIRFLESMQEPRYEYDQCGGAFFYGSSVCQSGLTCYKRSQWYSQCMRACPTGAGWDCENGNDDLVTILFSTDRQISWKLKTGWKLLSFQLFCNYCIIYFKYVILLAFALSIKYQVCVFL